jgi:thioredoxin 1
MNGGTQTMEENMPDTPLHVSDANLDSTVNKYPVMVVDCWAPWCGPCNMVGPVVEELARQMKGKVVFGKLNVDENPATSMKYGIMSIPSLLMFKNGQLIDTFVGAMPEPILREKITSHL